MDHVSCLTNFGLNPFIWIKKLFRNWSGIPLEPTYVLYKYVQSNMNYWSLNWTKLWLTKTKTVLQFTVHIPCLKVHHKHQYCGLNVLCSSLYLIWSTLPFIWSRFTILHTKVSTWKKLIFFQNYVSYKNNPDDRKQNSSDINILLTGKNDTCMYI